jgi:glycosyltransferase involved in cell wall biosynthesis
MKKVLLVLPVYNEEKVLERSVKRLTAYMSRNIDADWNIIIADNASKDSTAKIAKLIAAHNKKVKYSFIPEKGRGNALRKVWTSNKADAYAYCDIDLSTDIKSIKPMFDMILNGSDIVIGNRYLKGSKASRKIDRLVLSKGYNTLVRIFFKTKITDFQCGFKAISARVAKEVIPHTISTNWFFDTEFLVLAETAHKYQILQIPVCWKEESQMGDGRRSKVNKFDTIKEYIGWLYALRKRIRTEQQKRTHI